MVAAACLPSRWQNAGTLCSSWTRGVALPPKESSGRSRQKVQTVMTRSNGQLRSPWCDGNVALYGGSYVGATALLAARERPPSLRCVIANVTADDYYDGWVFSGGAFQLGFAATWSMTLASTSIALRSDYARRVGSEEREGLVRTMSRGLDPLWTRPLSELPSISAADVAPWWATWLEHDRRDGYWADVSLRRDYGAFQVPILHIGGWFDIFGSGTIGNYEGITAAGRTDQQLVVGPWAHTESGSVLGEMTFGPTGDRSAAGLLGDYNRFLDRHLRPGTRPTPTSSTPVRYFLMGANEWRLDTSWPPADSRPSRLYLHSGGKANTLHGDGALAETPPKDGTTADSYQYGSGSSSRNPRWIDPPTVHWACRSTRSARA